MAELVVKKLQFPGSDDQYLINAHALEGKRLSEITDLIEEVREELNAIAEFDALRYMGTIAAGSTAPGGLTTDANKGDVYKVTGSGYVMGVKVEAGDMLICNTDGTTAATSSNYTSIANNWDIIQTNIDVESILNHTHTGNVSFSKSDKTLSHTITPSKETLTASFTNGSATVTGGHGHTASGSVTLTPAGSVENASITPAGTVKLTAPSTAGSDDVTVKPSGSVEAATTKFVTGVTVNGNHLHTHEASTGQSSASVTGSVTIGTGNGASNYTPAGTVGNSNAAVTSVEAGESTLSHKAESAAAGGFTPAGTIRMNQLTPAGTVAAHNHGVSLSKTAGSKASFFNTAQYQGSGMDGVLVFGNSEAVIACDTYSVSEDNVAPEFTGANVTPEGQFEGTPVSAHTHDIEVDAHTFVPVINTTNGDHTHGFTGTGVQLTATHSLTASAHNHSVTVEEGGAADHIVDAPTDTHNHVFEGNNMFIHASFTGTPDQHNHVFTGAQGTHNVSVAVDDFAGNFTGSVSGTVTPSVSEVLTGVTIGNHTIETVDSATVTTGNGTQA